jgi:pantetheine-phosphate adenylyltransferase
VTRTAVYAGSFDPITVGHLDIIARGAALFDGVVVAVGNHPAKRYRFDLEQRCGLIRAACAALPNVRVEPFTGLLVHAVQRFGGAVILRGLRASADFDAELPYGLANRQLSGVETLFLLASPAQVHVSSSLVKEIHDNGGDVAKMVPPVVLDALRAKGAPG